MIQTPPPANTASIPRKILLLNMPRFTDGVPISREECAYGPSFGVPIPNALMNIGAVLKGRADITLHDSVLEKTPVAALGPLLDKLKPDTVISTILKPLLTQDKTIANLCAERGIRCIGIPAPIGFHEEVARSAPFHFVVWNEPEKTILDWATGTPIENLRGAAYINGGGIIKNEKQELYFDRIPHMDWTLAPDIRRYGWPLYQVARNCKWGCSFCVWATGAPRHKKVPVVIEDLSCIKERARGEIGVLCASITQDKKWFNEFIEKVTPLKIRYATDIRADEVTRENLTALKKSGCRHALLGAESFSQRILDGINKKETVEQNLQAIRWCNEIGIITSVTLVFNIGETDEEVAQYIRAANKSKPSRVMPVIYKYLDGTKEISAGPAIEKIFWGTDPYKTPADIDNALNRVALFKRKTRSLRYHLAWRYLTRPSLWPAFIELLRIKFR